MSIVLEKVLYKLMLDLYIFMINGEKIDYEKRN